MLGLTIGLLMSTIASTAIPDDNNFLSEWPSTGPELVFETGDIGNGYSSPTVTSEYIYLTGEKDGKGILHCFDLEGNIIWEKPYGHEWVQSYPGPRSSPLFSNGYLYISSGMGEIICMESSSGEILWSINMIDDLGGINVVYGYSMPLILHQDMLICSPGGKENNVVALNKTNGELVWSNPANKETAGYGSPLIIELPERNLLVTSSEFSILGMDADDGELLWSYELEFKGELPCNEPIYDGNKLYWSAGPVNGGVAVALNSNGSSIKVVWQNQKFDTFFGGIVDDKDYVYGSSQRMRKFISVNKGNGKIESQLSFWIGSVIRVSDFLIAYNQKGEIGLINTNSGKLNLISSFKIPSGTQEHFSHPVVKNGFLYIRNGDKLRAYNISKI